MRDTYIHMMAAASPYALLLDVVNQGLALYDVRTERYKILHKNEKRFSLMKGFTDSKGRIWLGEELKNFYQYFPKEEEILKKCILLDMLMTSSSPAIQDR